jgi:hypothetical protein
LPNPLEVETVPIRGPAIVTKKVNWKRFDRIMARPSLMLVYFMLLAGVYLTGGNPFEGLDASGYLRYAGLVSAGAFAIAYDPSLFSELLSRIPRTGGK